MLKRWCQFLKINWNLEMTAVFKEFIWLLIIDWLPFYGRKKVCPVLNRFKICVVYGSHFWGIEIPSCHFILLVFGLGRVILAIKVGFSMAVAWWLCSFDVPWVTPVQALYLCPLSIIAVLTGAMPLTVAWHIILYYNFIILKLLLWGR